MLCSDTQTQQWEFLSKNFVLGDGILGSLQNSQENIGLILCLKEGIMDTKIKYRSQRLHLVVLRVYPRGFLFVCLFYSFPFVANVVAPDDVSVHCWFLTWDGAVMSASGCPAPAVLAANPRTQSPWPGEASLIVPSFLLHPWNLPPSIYANKLNFPHVASRAQLLSHFALPDRTHKSVLMLLFAT